MYLGFGTVVEPHLSYRLLAHYLPLGKVGGKPAWLNPVNLPSSSSLLCRVCEQPMAFLLQVYATNPGDEAHSFHRTLYFFICRNQECSRTNDASNIRAFRCTLARCNDFYSPEKPFDPDLDGEIADPYWKPSYPHLCELCGCFATKKCARCESVWYCCREHQTADWNAVHKLECCAPKLPTDECAEEQAADDSITLVKPKRSKSANGFVFPEYAIEMDVERSSKYNLPESDDESPDVDIKERIKEFQDYAKAHKDVCSVELAEQDAEDIDGSLGEDSAFKRFGKIIALNPEQIIRYDRGGVPLLSTDYAPSMPVIPPCSLCGCSRNFEMQIMPNLLALIGVDRLGNSIDWATLLLYTCSKNCPIPDHGYAEEFVVKQDFSG